MGLRRKKVEKTEKVPKRSAWHAARRALWGISGGESKPRRNANTEVFAVLLNILFVVKPRKKAGPLRTLAPMGCVNRPGLWLVWNGGVWGGGRGGGVCVEDGGMEKESREETKHPGKWCGIYIHAFLCTFGILVNFNFIWGPPDAILSLLIFIGDLKYCQPLLQLTNKQHSVWVE